MAVIDMSDIPIPKKKRAAVRFTILVVLAMLGVGGWAGWVYLLQTPPEASCSTKLLQDKRINHIIEWQNSTVP